MSNLESHILIMDLVRNAHYAPYKTKLRCALALRGNLTRKQAFAIARMVHLREKPHNETYRYKLS